MNEPTVRDPVHETDRAYSRTMRRNLLAVACPLTALSVIAGALGAEQWWYLAPLVLAISRAGIFALEGGIRRRARALTDEHAHDLRTIGLPDGAYARISAGQASISGPGEAGLFVHPADLLAAIRTLDRHVRVVLPSSAGLRAADFAADADFLRQCALYLPEAPEAPDLAHEIMLALHRAAGAGDGLARVASMTRDGRLRIAYARGENRLAIGMPYPRMAEKRPDATSGG